MFYHVILDPTLFFDTLLVSGKEYSFFWISDTRKSDCTVEVVIDAGK